MSVIVVIYSRYCNESLQFLESLEKNTETVKMDIRKLCIDNENIRERVLDSKLGINSVPTILIYHANGEVEKYEENTCFEWLDFIIEKLKPESVPEPVEKKEKLQPILDENDLLDSKIPVEHISNDTPEKRKLNSDVLIKNINSENKLDSEKELKEEKANERMQKNNQNEGILTLAQQMQKEREGDNNVKK
jgi:thioredoxin-like negative regulator of GroEL